MACTADAADTVTVQRKTRAMRAGIHPNKTADSEVMEAAAEWDPRFHRKKALHLVYVFLLPFISLARG